MKTYHQQALTRGVYPVRTQVSSEWNDIMTEAVAGAKRMGFVESGDSIVLTAGMPLEYDRQDQSHKGHNCRIAEMKKQHNR